MISDRLNLIYGAHVAILRLRTSATELIVQRHSCPWFIKSKRQKKFIFVVVNEPKRRPSVMGPITRFDVSVLCTISALVSQAGASVRVKDTTRTASHLLPRQ